MSLLSREALLKRRPRRTKSVMIDPDFSDRELAGQTILVQAMTARERAEFEKQFVDKSGKPIPSRHNEIRERLVIATVVDKEGNLLFADGDLPALKEVDAAILEAIVKASQELNSISTDDLDELAKNSSATPS